MKTETEERIDRMRRGEKLPCPKCSAGHFFAFGDPKTTNVFGCDKCQIKMTLTSPMQYK